MKKIISTLFLIGTICLLFDIIVSYAVFINATDYFMKNELNKYMILEFQHYNLSIIFIRNFIFPIFVLQFLLILWIKFSKFIKDINKDYYLFCNFLILFFLFLFSFNHIIGVLSWLY